MSVDPDLVRQLQRRVGELLQDQQRQRRAAGQHQLRGEEERQFGRACIQRAITEFQAKRTEAGQTPISWEDEHELTKAIEARVFGAGRLQDLIDDDTIEDIAINGYDNVFVTYYDGTKKQVDPIADSDEELIEQIRVLGAHAGLSSRPFDSANPELDLRMPDGSRLAAIMGNTPQPCVSIRRHRLMKATLPELVGTQTMSQQIADFLACAVKARLNICIGGGTGAGKTTLLRALLNEVPSSERIITVEKALEIGLDHNKEAHPDIVVMEESLANSENKGGVTMAQLLRRTLRLNPDRVIVGEVLGPEIVTMLNAMSQGNEGSLSTLHARSARVMFERMATYAKQSEEKLDSDTTAQLIASGLDLIVYMAKSDDSTDGKGRHRVIEILEVTGYDGDKVSASSLFNTQGGVEAVRNPSVAMTDQRAALMTRAGWVDQTGWGHR